MLLQQFKFPLFLSLFTLTAAISPVAYAGAGSGGGGDMAAAQFTQIAVRAYESVYSICKLSSVTLKQTDTDLKRVCPTLDLLIGHIDVMWVQPRGRDKIRLDHKPRITAHTNLDTVLLDIDRWEDLRNETDSGKILESQTQQIITALHEPLVILGYETEDSSLISNSFTQILQKNQISLETLILGAPKSEISSMLAQSEESNTALGKLGSGGPSVVLQYSAIAKRAYEAALSICNGPRDAYRDDLEHNQDEWTVCHNTITSDLNSFLTARMSVIGQSRGQIRGRDKQTRDAGNDHQSTVFLDVDRWNDLQNETDPNKLWAARVQQVTLALHEPLVLTNKEVDDCYWDSDQVVNLLLRNHVNFFSLVGSSE